MEGYFAGLTMGIIVCLCFTAAFNDDKPTDNNPTALDVYRGKTTLEITYRDSVAVDSVVVYKMK